MKSEYYRSEISNVFKDIFPFRGTKADAVGIEYETLNVDKLTAYTFAYVSC